MVVPPFIGQEVVRRAGMLSDEKGYVTVRETYQTDKYSGRRLSRRCRWSLAASVPRQCQREGRTLPDSR